MLGLRLDMAPTSPLGTPRPLQDHLMPPPHASLARHSADPAGPLFHIFFQLRVLWLDSMHQNGG